MDSAGDTDNDSASDDADMEDLHCSVVDIDSGDFSGTVADIGLMHALIREYTHAQIRMIEGASYGGYDVFDYFDTHYFDAHYKKLSALWHAPACGRPVKLFSPTDALSWPEPTAAFDGAIASIIAGLPATGVDWVDGSPLMYAIKERHGRRTIEALCSRGAFFAETEYDDAIRAVVCDAPVAVMEAALDGLASNEQGHFILRSFSVDQDMGTALHVCCSTVSTGEGLFERICVLLKHGVNPSRVTTRGNLRAADMLALRAKQVMVGSDPERELMECARRLAREGAGPFRHHLREVAKLMELRRMPTETEAQIVKEATSLATTARRRGLMISNSNN